MRTSRIAIWAVLAALFACSAARAQNGSITGVTFSPSGRPAGGVNVAICQTLTTTGATLTSNIATLSFASNPQAQGFTVGATITVSQFTGGDTYFNGSFPIAAVTTSTVSYSIVHANGTAGSNGVAYQIGTTVQACAPLATTFTDQTGATNSPNPFTSDGLGNYTAWVAPGYYIVQLYGPTVSVNFYVTGVACFPTSAVSGCFGSIGGSLANTQVAFGTAANTIGGSSSITWTPSGTTGTFGLFNTAPATAIVTGQNSPNFTLNGAVWNGAASQADQWLIQDVVSVASGGNLTFTHPAGIFGVVSIPGNSLFLGQAGVTSGTLEMFGVGSGQGGWTVNAAAGSPHLMAIPTADPAGGGYLLAATPGNPVGTNWVNTVPFSFLTAAANTASGTFSLAATTWDVHSTTHTLPTANGTSAGKPGTCTIGELYFGTDATAGQNLFMCTSLNVWTQQLNSGAGGASTALSNLAAVAINTSLLPAAVNTVALGSSSFPFTNLFLRTTGAGNFSFTNIGNLTAGRTGFIPDANSMLVQDCPASTNQFVTSIPIATGLCARSLIAASATMPNAYAADSGAANAAVVTLSPAITSYTTGLEVDFLPTAANTLTNPTVNVNGLGAITITKFGTAVLQANDLITTQIAKVVYDGTHFQLQNPATLSSTVTSSSVNTFTNKTEDCEATGNNCTMPQRAFFTAGGCNNSTPENGFDIGTANAPTPACQGSTVRKGVLQFARGNVAYINWHLPVDWNSSGSTDLELGFTTTDTTNGHVTSFNIQTGCNKTDGTATDDPALNAFQALSVTTGASQVSGGELTGTKTGLTMTGCSPDYNFEIVITRNNSGTDTNTDALVGVKFAEIVTSVTKNAANR